MTLGIVVGAVFIVGGMIWLLRNIDSNTALGVIVLGVAVIFASTVFAHDHTRPELKPWFMELRNKNKVACCDGSDATRLNDIDWESRDGHYRVWINNQWIDVPDEAVIEEPNRAGETMVWPMYYNGQITIRCFIPGALT